MRYKVIRTGRTGGSQANERNVNRSLSEMARQSRSAHSDILGSYTGVPADPTDPMPVQDADDL